MTTVERLNRMRLRRSGGLPILLNRAINEAYERIQEDDVVKYLVGSMQPIDQEYTKNTIAEADRIKSQLQSGYSYKSVSAGFDYQGSVTNDTHILRYSDIDLLTITSDFSYRELPVTLANAVSALDCNAILLKQHNASVSIIRSNFPEVTIDASGGKAIQLSGGSLRRKIDVVTTAWWDTIAYERSNEKRDRGIKVFNYLTHDKIANRPFLHNYNIDLKDNVCSGNLRRAIRFLKTLKADANDEAGYAKVDLSSYDICAIAYAMGYDRLIVGADEELKLARNTQQFLDYLEQNEAYRNSLDVPNGTRRIFCTEGASVEGVRSLNQEVKNLLNEISSGLQRSFRTLDARIRR